MDSPHNVTQRNAMTAWTNSAWPRPSKPGNHLHASSASGNGRSPTPSNHENGGGGTLNPRDDNNVFAYEVQDGNGAGGQGFELTNNAHDAHMNGRHSSSSSGVLDIPDNFDDEGEDEANGFLALLVSFFNSRAWRLIGSMIIVFAFAMAAVEGVSKFHQQKQIEASMQSVDDCRKSSNIVASISISRESPANSNSVSAQAQFSSCNAVTSNPGPIYDPTGSGGTVYTCIENGYACTAGNNDCKGKTTGSQVIAQCCSCLLTNGCAGAGAGSFCGESCPVSSRQLQTPTPEPTPAPTTAPTPAPTSAPTPAPTTEPTPAPTLAPTPAPTSAPTPAPTTEPTPAPTLAPTPAPTSAPTPAPTTEPTPAPTLAPTPAPTSAPTPAPTTEPTPAPTLAPTPAPTSAPTPAPTTEPTPAPTLAPTPAPTSAPTPAPTTEPTPAPTLAPTPAPTSAPTPAPTTEPTPAPTLAPTPAPTSAPTPAPTTEPTPAPTLAPTPAPTLAPTPAPTPAPTSAPTPAPTTEPTHNPTDNPTHAPTDNPTDTPTDNPTHAPTDSPTPAIKSWALELTSVNTDFDKGSEDEIILRYKIGKNRTPRVTLHKTGCEDDISGITIIPKEELTNGNGDDPSTSNYEVSLDINKSSIAGSNIWDSADNAVKLCVMVALISSETDAVVKKLERNIEVALDFENNFQTIEDANFTKISLDSNETEAAVEKYIKACTCNNKEDFICNTNSLGVDDFLNVCISSQDEEMEINYLDSLQMTQEGEGDEANVLNIVSNQDLVDGSISSKSKVAANNGVHVASVIPASFFSYESSSTATVSGVVFLKLYGSRRRLAVEMDDSSSTATHARALQGGAASDNQQSAFSMKVQLEKNEFLEITDDPNSAIYAYAAMTGVIGSAAAVVTAATFLMW